MDIKEYTGRFIVKGRDFNDYNKALSYAKQIGEVDVYDTHRGRSYDIRIDKPIGENVMKRYQPLFENDEATSPAGWQGGGEPDEKKDIALIDDALKLIKIIKHDTESISAGENGPDINDVINIENILHQFKKNEESEKH